MSYPVHHPNPYEDQKYLSMDNIQDSHSYRRYHNLHDEVFDPYLGTGRGQAHRMSNHHYQDTMLPGLIEAPGFHSSGAFGTSPDAWLCQDRKPNLTFPTPAHVYEQYQKMPTAYNSQNRFDPLAFQRTTLAGSLDPTTGIFYRTPEHPRLRTAQACEKCRTRKAKCSGEHPSCKRCINRNLVCEYAKEGRIRGPNRPKPGSIDSREDVNGLGRRPGNSRDGTPTHLGTPSSGESDQGSSAVINMDMSSFGEHRPLRSRPSDLQLSSLGHSPPTPLRRSRNDIYGSLYSTTPLQSPISPTFSSDTTLNNSLVPFIEQPPAIEGHQQALPYPPIFDDSTFPPVKEDYPNTTQPTLSTHCSEYSTLPTNFEYGTGGPSFIMPDADPTTHLGSRPPMSTINDQSQIALETQQLFLHSSNWDDLNRFQVPPPI